jgi:hypothetical protein
MHLRYGAVVSGLSIAALLLVLGCGSMDQGPGDFESPTGTLPVAADEALHQSGDQASVNGGFYPLAIGNEWTYRSDFVVTMGGDTSSAGEASERRTIIGMEERFGRPYFLEQQTTTDEDGDTLTVYWLRYRQDRSGLYEADIAITEPPLSRLSRAFYVAGRGGTREERLAAAWRRLSANSPRASAEAYQKAWNQLERRLRAIHASLGMDPGTVPRIAGRRGGVLPEELTRLHYPLHPSAEWVILDDPLVAATVESHDVLDLPSGKMSGWKIRLMSNLYGPNDTVIYWYGRDGFLGSQVHVETEARDASGNPIGKITIEESLFLVDYSLVSRGR